VDVFGIGFASFADKVDLDVFAHGRVGAGNSDLWWYILEKIQVGEEKKGRR
jgi:hypothetical protein